MKSPKTEETFTERNVAPTDCPTFGSVDKNTEALSDVLFSSSHGVFVLYAYVRCVCRNLHLFISCTDDLPVHSLLLSFKWSISGGLGGVQVWPVFGVFSDPWPVSVNTSSSISPAVPEYSLSFTRQRHKSQTERHFVHNETLDSEVISKDDAVAF